MNHIILNDISSQTIQGLVIQELPPITLSPMRVLRETIDGRDGDISTFLGRDAYDKPMKIGLSKVHDIDAVIGYFANNMTGDVVFSNESDKHYLYEITDQIDFERLVRFREATITFHCQPYKYPNALVPIEDEVENITDTTPYLYRISADGQDIGSQEFDEIHGGTVAWNQLIQNPNFADGTNNWLGNNATISASNNVLTLTDTHTSGTGIYQLINEIPIDHVVLFMAKFKRNQTGSKMSRWGMRYNNETMHYHATITYDGTDVHELWGVGKLTASANRCYFYPQASGGAVGDTQEVYYLNLIDLTQMLGSTIADYINTLERTTASGVAFFKSLFPNEFYAYDSGTLMSVQTSEHKMVGKNLIRTDDDSNFNTSIQRWGQSDTTLRDRINALPVGRYTCSFKFRIDTITGSATSGSYGITFRFNNGSVVDKYVRETVSNIEASTEYSYSRSFEITSDIVGKCTSAIFYTGRSPVASADYVTFYDFQFEYGNTATPYEPYTVHSYPLDSSLTLRGIPKLDANNKLYYDGDIYQSNGTVTRKYGIVDLGSLTWQTRATGSVNKVFSSTLPSNYMGKLTTPVNWVSEAQYIQPVSASYLINNVDTVKTGVYSYNGTSASTNVIYCVTLASATPTGHLVYELATPTTETATPYTNPQIVAKGGTEEYVDTRDVAIPVGHNTRYPSDVDITVNNVGNAPSKPIITIYGNGVVNLYINGNQMLQLNMGNYDYITIDTEAQNAYCGGVLANRNVTGDYSKIILPVGESHVSTDGDVSQVIISNYVRWY